MNQEADRVIFRKKKRLQYLAFRPYRQINFFDKILVMTGLALERSLKQRYGTANKKVPPASNARFCESGAIPLENFMRNIKFRIFAPSLRNPAFAKPRPR